MYLTTEGGHGVKRRDRFQATVDSSIRLFGVVHHAEGGALTFGVAVDFILGGTQDAQPNRSKNVGSSFLTKFSSHVRFSSPRFQVAHEGAYI